MPSSHPRQNKPDEDRYSQQMAGLGIVISMFLVKKSSGGVGNDYARSVEEVGVRWAIITACYSQQFNIKLLNKNLCCPNLVASFVLN
jgi:hypothetical protein